MLVVGSIIGASIFVVPQVVARRISGVVPTPGAWILGGVASLTGACIFVELACRIPRVGGPYAYLKDAYHPESRSCTDGACCWCADRRDRIGGGDFRALFS